MTIAPPASAPNLKDDFVAITDPSCLRNGATHPFVHKKADVVVVKKSADAAPLKAAAPAATLATPTSVAIANEVKTLSKKVKQASAKPLSDKATLKAVGTAARESANAAPADIEADPATIVSVVADTAASNASTRRVVTAQFYKPTATGRVLETCMGYMTEKSDDTITMSKFRCPAVNGACPRKMDACQVTRMLTVPHALAVSDDGATALTY